MNTRLIARAAALALIAGAASTAAVAQTPAPAAIPEHTFTGNATLVSDYRFRGISQTFKLPAAQVGFDYAHSSGVYVGNWNSNVSGNQYPGGASLEMDLYAGWKGEVAKDLTLDVGGLLYYYPGANYKNFVGGANQKFTNGELYVGLVYGPVSGKLSYAVTDYFGLSNAVGGKGSSKGTMYLDLNYTTEIAAKTNLVAHVGYTKYKNYSDFDYTDVKLGVTYDLSGWTLGASVFANDVKNAGKGFYTGVSPAGDTKKLYTSGVVLSVGKTF